MVSAQSSILLLFPDSENKRILERALRPAYTICAEAEDPDTIFVDSLEWHKHQAMIEKIRTRQAPVYVPTLLYVHRVGATMQSHDLWQQVDDLIVAPVNPVLLNTRLQVHLRTRGLSKKLKAQNRTLTIAQQAVKEQHTFANALREIGNALTKKQSLEGIFNYVMDQIDRLIPNDAITIMLLKDRTLQVVGRRGYTIADLIDTTPNTEIALDDTRLLKQIVQRAQPIAVSDMSNDEEITLFKHEARLKAYAGVPITSRGNIIGILNIYSRNPGQYSSHVVDRLLALADQLAIAIESARLYDQAQTVAVLEERQRLARDLHDSVTQTLFSATVMIETAQNHLSSDPTTVRSLLDELHQATRGALAETRTILLELYPTKIADLPLSELLHQVGEAIWSRKQIHLNIQVSPDSVALPNDRKVAFYGIAKEALNNIAKHAHARTVTLSFQIEQSEEQMIVADDGQGFNIEETTTGFGLGIMRERAEAMGAQFKLTSKVGDGTQITVTWVKGKNQ